MLGDADAAGGGDDRRRRGNIERVFSVATGAACIEQYPVGFDFNTVRFLPHGFGKSGDFIHRFALHPQCGQQAADLRGGRFAFHERVHNLPRFFARRDARPPRPDSNASPNERFPARPCVAPSAESHNSPDWSLSPLFPWRQHRFRQLIAFSIAFCFVDRFLVFLLRHGIFHDACPGLHISFAVLEDDRADRNARIKLPEKPR